MNITYPDLFLKKNDSLKFEYFKSIFAGRKKKDFFLGNLKI